MIKGAFSVCLRRCSAIKIYPKEKVRALLRSHFAQNPSRNLRFSTNSSGSQEESTKPKRSKRSKTASEVEECQDDKPKTDNRSNTASEIEVQDHKPKKSRSNAASEVEVQDDKPKRSRSNAASEIEAQDDKPKRRSRSNAASKIEVHEDNMNPDSFGENKKPRLTKVIEYYSSEKHLKPVLDIFPSEFMQLKKRIDELYVAEESTADQIASILADHIPKTCDYVMEANPGPGLITKKLLKRGYRLKLFEANEFFLPSIMDLQKKHSNLLSVEHTNFLNICINKYTRSNIHRKSYHFLNLLKDFEKRPWESDTIKIIVGVGNNMFLGNLVANCFSCRGLPDFGRPELFCFILPSVYRKLTSSPFKDKLSYRTSSILFQSVFDSEVLNVLPRKSFLPWAAAKRTSASYFEELYRENESILYLVRICGKKNFYSKMENQENLDLYMKFVRQFFKYHGLRVIPLLERWFPNCGPKLIEAKIGVFTHFSDLGPNECQTLFSICKSFPDFDKSPFFSVVSQPSLDVLHVSDEKKTDKSEGDSSGNASEIEDEDEDEVTRL